jgi:lactoylglutathione lyase
MGVRGLFETHLTVTDLQRSVAFYRDVVGLQVALEVPERGAVFHWIGNAGQAMLGLWSIGSAPMNMQLHIAFDMALTDVLAAPEHLLARDIQPLSFFGEPASEPASLDGCLPQLSTSVTQMATCSSTWPCSRVHRDRSWASCLGPSADNSRDQMVSARLAGPLPALGERAHFDRTP